MSITRLTAVCVFSALVALSFGVTSKVCVDAGHGGSDPGASGAGGIEKTNVLNTSLKFRNWMNTDTNDGAGGGSWSVVMTRTTDVAVSLQGRCDISNNNACNYFMCIHNNAFNTTAYGTETFACAEGGTAADLRNKVQYRMLNAWGRYNRGNKTANYYVLLYTNAPAELAELAFVDNASDGPYVSGAATQDSAGLAHLYAIQTRCGLGAYKPGTAPVLPTYTLDNNQAGFTVSANWTTGSSAADKYGADYRYRSTAAVSDQAQWSISVGTAGTYKIQAWWPAGTNRSATAPFTLPNGAAVSANQQANGGKFNVLGTIGLGTGAQVTKLSCWTTTGFVVMADAVRYGP